MKCFHFGLVKWTFLWSAIAVGLQLFCLESLAATHRNLIRPNLKVGLALPISGGMAPYGQEVERGAQIALEMILAADSELGQRISLETTDHGGLNKKAESVSLELMTNQRIHLLIGGLSTGIARKLSQIATDQKRPFISLAALHDSKGSFTFDSCQSRHQQGNTLSQFSLTNLKAKTALLVLEEQSSYAEEIGSQFSEAFQKAGGKILGSLSFPSGSMDVKDLSKKISEIAADVTVLPAHYRDAYQIIKAAKKKRPQLVFLGSDSWDGATFLSESSDISMNGLYYYVPFTSQDPSPHVREFAQLFEKKFQRQPSAFAFNGYEALMSAIEVFQRADSNRSASLVRAFSSGYCHGPSMANLKNETAEPWLPPGAIMATGPKGAQFFQQATF